MKKYFVKRFLLLFILYVLICFFMINYEVLSAYQSFDVNAPDLPAGKGEEIRDQLHVSAFSYAVIFRDFSSLNELILPFFISLLVPLYSTYRKKFLRYSVGSEVSYTQITNKSKWKFSFGICLIFSTVFIIYLTLSAYFTGLAPRESANFANTFRHLFLENDYLLLLIYFIVTNLFILFSGYVLLSYSESSLSPIRLSIIYLLIMYLINSFIYIFIGYKLTVTASINWLYTGSNLSAVQLSITFVYLFIAWIIQKKFIPKEV